MCLVPDQFGSLTGVAQDLVEARLQEGVPVRFHVFTKSMLPTLHPGDSLVVQSTSPGGIETGAIVVVRKENTWVVHRLIRRHSVRETLRLQTKGDNRFTADPAYNSVLLIGVVKSIQRGNRSIDLLTWRARLGGRGLASLSWAQAKLYLSEPGPLRKILLWSLHQGIYFLAFLVYKL